MTNSGNWLVEFSHSGLDYLARFVEAAEKLTRQILECKQAVPSLTTVESQSALEAPAEDVAVETLNKCLDVWTGQCEAVHLLISGASGWHPIHLAALLKSPSAVERVFNKDPSSANAACHQGTCSVTPLMCAVLAGCKKTLGIILKAGAQFSQCNPIELLRFAILGNDATCFDLVVNYIRDLDLSLLQLTPKPVNILSMFESGALNASSGHIFSQLIHANWYSEGHKNAMVVNLVSPLVVMDLRQLLFLFVRKDYLELTGALLEFRPFLVNTTDNERRTSIHLTIVTHYYCQHEDDVVEMLKLLLRFRPNLSLRDATDKTAFTYAVNAKLEECCNLLLSSNPDVSISDINVLEERLPNFYSKHLRKLITLRNDEGKMGINLRPIKALCKPRTETGERYFLQYIVAEQREDLLKDCKGIAIQTYLHLRWQSFRRIFWFIFAIYMLQLLCYTKFVSFTFADKLMEEKTYRSNLSEIKEASSNSFHEFTMIVAMVGAYLIFAIRFTFFLTKSFALKIKVGPIRYFVEVFPILTTLIPLFTISSLESGAPPTAPEKTPLFSVRTASGISIFIAWANTIWYFTPHPELGIYVEMLYKVSINFAKFFVTYLCLLIGFAMTFSVMLTGKAPFQNPVTSFVEVLRMMAGSLDNEALDNAGIGTCAFYTIFILTITLFLVNLLIGLAVDDIKELTAASKLAKTIRLINYMNSIEKIFYKLESRFPEMFVKSWVRKLIQIPDCQLPDRVEFNPYKSDDSKIPTEMKQQALIAARKNDKEPPQPRSMQELSSVYCERDGKWGIFIFSKTSTQTNE